MVKVAAPCLSLDASGSIAGAMTYGKWKGRPYVRALVKPANPQSGGQVGVRRMLKFLSQDWANLSAGQKATWEDLATQKVVSPFNAFVGENMKGWRNFLAPSIEYPIDRTGTPTQITGEAATAGIRQILLEWDLAGVLLNWGVMIFRSTATPVVTAWTNHVQTMRCDTVDSFSWIDTPLAAGTYYYNFRVFDINGVMGAEETEVNATVV